MNRSIFFIAAAVFAPLHGHSLQEYMQQAAQALKEKNGEYALELLHKAYDIQKDNPQTLSQLGSTYYLLGKYDQATCHFEQLLAISGQSTVRFNVAMAYCKQGLFTKAIPHLELLRESYGNSPSLKGLLLKLYLRNKQWRKAEEILSPSLWWFDANIVGKSILLELDKEGNGLGDSIQFIRYAQHLKQAGATVIAKVQKPLVDLFNLCPFIDAVLTDEPDDLQIDHRYSICIASLMCKTKNMVATQSLQKPYLYAAPHLIPFWKKQLENDPNVKVGLCWQSNFVRNSFTGQIMPSPRAVSLNELQQLDQPGISFYSLQKDADLSHAPFEIIQFSDDFDQSHGRFMDTAALIMNCDVIITVDTSIAHLAGALGKPTWVLLNCESDYRWFDAESFSYWYPQMKLFRQQKYGNWQPVIAAVADALTHISKE